MDIRLQFHRPFIWAVWRSDDVDLRLRHIISDRLDSRRCARADSIVMVANWFACRLDSWQRHVQSCGTPRDSCSPVVGKKSARGYCAAWRDRLDVGNNASLVEI